MARYEPAADEPLLTPSETAERFRVDVKTTTRWAKAGKLHVRRTLGGHRRFFENEIKALLRGETWTPPPGLLLEVETRDPLEAPLHTLDLSVAVRNRLRDEGVTMVGGLADPDTGLTAADLDDLGLRPGQVDDVRLALARRGLALRGEILGNVALQPGRGGGGR